ncbi:MAG: PaaI family thioesterase [Prevotella sp.]
MKTKNRFMQTHPISCPLPDAEHGLCGHLGIRFVAVEEGLVTATMPVDERTCQPFGILHGGASLALAESVAGQGSLLLCPSGLVPCGIQVSGNHLRMVQQGTTVVAEGRLLFRGKTQHVWSVDIRTSEGELVSTIRVVNQIVKRRA